MRDRLTFACMTDAEGRTRRKKRWFNGAILPGILAFILHTAFIQTGGLQSGHSVFKAADFVRYDSYLYQEIARNGYDLFPCHEKFEEYDETSGAWCGNAGWMPLYPLLIRILHATGLHEYTASYLISTFFCLFTYIFTALLIRQYTGKAWSLLMLPAIFFPSSVYYNAAFPVSLMLCLMLAGIYFWNEKKYTATLLCSLLLPLSYSTGFTGALIWMLYAFILYKRKDSRTKQAFYTSLAYAAGFLVFMTWQWIATGTWNAFFLVQAKYGHGIHNFLPDLRDLFLGIFGPGLQVNWQPVQTLLILGTTVYFITNYKSTSNMQLLPLIVVGFLGLFPFLIGSNQLSMFRAESLLLPMILLLPEKKNVLLILSICFAVLNYACTYDFFISKII